jgi:hypothetical protein
MMPTPQKTVLTAEEFAALYNLREHPADMRERLRAKLGALPDVARRVYNRENIRDPHTDDMTIIETVLYHFDHGNRNRVAVALGMDYDAMLTLLIGYVLGRGE